MSGDVVPADVFKLAMRRLAAGVTIITTCHDGHRCGLTATAVCSLSADPPQLLVCVNRSSQAHDIIKRGANLCVNLLARRHKALAARFAGQKKGVAGEERFRAGKWTTLKTTAPVLDDALASFDCVVRETVESSTHTIFIGNVVDVRLRAEGHPLLYAGGAYAGLQVIADRRKRATVTAVPRRPAKRRRAKRA
jgi:flavin reductase (DIM6/NTAB) family NADH-FMN oxidoreductase RutF